MFTKEDSVSQTAGFISPYKMWGKSLIKFLRRFWQDLFWLSGLSAVPAVQWSSGLHTRLTCLRYLQCLSLTLRPKEMTEDRTPLISSPDSDTDTLTEMTYKARPQGWRYEFPFTPRKKRVGRITLFWSCEKCCHQFVSQWSVCRQLR